MRGGGLSYCCGIEKHGADRATRVQTNASLFCMEVRAFRAVQNHPTRTQYVIDQWLNGPLRNRPSLRPTTRPRARRSRTCTTARPGPAGAGHRTCSTPAACRAAPRDPDHPPGTVPGAREISATVNFTHLCLKWESLWQI